MFLKEPRSSHPMCSWMATTRMSAFLAAVSTANCLLVDTATIMVSDESRRGRGA
jgi:hypothetical protein